MGISFFTNLTDPNLAVAEARAINAALERGEADKVALLQGQLSAQEREIKLLRAAVGVLAAMLRDNGIVDGEMLDLRLEAAMENAEEEIGA